MNRSEDCPVPDERTDQRRGRIPLITTLITTRGRVFRWILVVLFALVTGAYLLSLTLPAVGNLHDDGIYLTTAVGLATGQGYVITSLPEEFRQTKYPVVLPFLLAVVWRMHPVFPDNLLLLKLVPFVSIVLWLSASAMLIKRLGKSNLAAGLIVLFASVSSWMIYVGTNLRAEAPFAFLCTCALLLLEHDENPRHIPTWLCSVLVGSTSGLAYLTSVRGVTIWVAALAIYMLRRSWRQALWSTAAFGACVGPWFVWQSLGPNSPTSAYWYYSQNSYVGWHIFSGLSLEQAIDVVSSNLSGMARWPQTMYCIVPKGSNGFLSYGVPFAVTLVALAGIFADARTKIRGIHVWTAGYLAILAIWAWPPTRLMVPLLPLCLYFVWRGLRLVTENVHFGGTTSRVFACILLGVILTVCMRNAARDLRMGLVFGSPTIAGNEPDDWDQTMKITNWLRENTPKDAVIGGLIDPIVFMFGERKSIRPFRVRAYELYYNQPESRFPLGDVAEFRDHLLQNDVSYICSTPTAHFLEDEHFLKLLGGLASAYPGVLQLVKKGSDPRYCVFRVDLSQLRAPVVRAKQTKLR